MFGEIKKGLLLVRAGYECEYCKRLLSDTEYQIDHIWPESRGGKSVDDNIAISCQRCNKNKSHHVEWIDPITGSSYPLFNPRTREWNRHFRRSHDEVIGITEIGRATAALLFRNTPQYLPPDLRWDKIEGLYENQSLYYFLNHLRYRRLRNDFSVLYKQLMTHIPPADASPQEEHIASFARDLLLLELYFTRSTTVDISKGITYGENLLTLPYISFHERAEILSILSILYQQRATVHFGQGSLKAANLDQKAAYNLYIAARPSEGDELPRISDPHNLDRFLRTHALRWKYGHVNLGYLQLNHCFKLISDMDPFYATSHYSYLLDMILLNDKPPLRMIECLYERITSILEKEGYGASIDQAKLITLRRRWWVLHFMLESIPNRDALIADVGFWKQVSMFNEIRELDSYFKRVSVDTRAQKDITEIITKKYTDS